MRDAVARRYRARPASRGTSRDTRISSRTPASCLPLLASNRAKRWVVDAIDDARIRLDFAVWAFVIMPEHVHILLCPLRPQYEMRTILVGLKRPVSDAARRYLESQGHSKWLDRLLIGEGPKQKFRFWQSGGGFDRNVTHERTIPSIVDYIHGNPVRRGLVSTPADWRWSSAAFWEGRADGPIKLDRPLTR